MAIWQYKIYIIPRHSLLIKYGNPPKQLNLEEALDVEWWSSLSIPFAKFSPILEEFGTIQDWTVKIAGLKSYGDVTTNDISVGYDEITNVILDLHVRLDLREVNKPFLNKVFSLARKFDCLLMDVQGKLFSPDLSAIAHSISMSNANRFVQDPETFLQDLSDGFVTPEGKS